MFSSTDPRAQQRERIQVAVGQLANDFAGQAPALVRTLRSLHMSVPAAEFYATGERGDQPGAGTVELWGHILEWCPRTLADDLEAARGRGLGAEPAIRLLLPVIRTLDFMHGLGYIHRDLDPSNILIAEDGTLRVADFGIAVHIHAQHTHTMTEAWGKPGRMPPEAVQGAHVPVGPAYDAWQVGFLLAEVATGARPILPSGMFNPRINDLPKPVRDVARQLLHPDRETRLSLRDAVESLRTYVASLPVTAHPPKPQPPESPPRTPGSPGSAAPNSRARETTRSKPSAQSRTVPMYVLWPALTLRAVAAAISAWGIANGVRFPAASYPTGFPSAVPSLSVPVTPEAVNASESECGDPVPVDGRQLQRCRLRSELTPVYASSDGGVSSDPVGSLGGTKAYFVGQHRSSSFVVGGQSTNYWAYTRADNSEWGWVPIIYLSNPPKKGPYPGLAECGDACR
jgi:serine/threonine protein kinase